MRGLSYLGQLPYGYGSEAWKKRCAEALGRETPKEVNCFGVEKYEILAKQLIVKIWNPKIGCWQEEIAVEYEDICPVCGGLMLVRAIKGTTWTACCSKECYEKYFEIRNSGKPEAEVKEVNCHSRRNVK